MSDWIEIKVDDHGLLKDMQMWPDKITQSQEFALHSCGSKISKDTGDFIESGGNGTWPKKHPLSALFSKNPGKYDWDKRSGGGSPFYEMANLVRYSVNKKADFLMAGFGNFSSRDVRKGKPLRFNDRLERLGQEMVHGKTTPVSPKMRRKLASAKGVYGKEANKHFFPIKKTTTSLVSPKRPLDPVLNRLQSSLPMFLSQRFEEAMERRDL